MTAILFDVAMPNTLWWFDSFVFPLFIKNALIYFDRLKKSIYVALQLCNQPVTEINLSHDKFCEMEDG